MRSLALVGLAAVLLSVSAQAAVQAGSQVRITTTAGSTITGTVVSETATGLLVSTGGKTEMIRFENVASIDDLSAPAAPRRSDAPVAATLDQRQLVADQLRADIKRREAKLPSSTVGITLLGVGGGALVAGAAMLGFGISGGYNCTYGRLAFCVAGVGVMVLGITSGIIGLITMMSARTERQRIDLMRDELEDLERRAAAPKWLRDLTVAMF